DTRTVQSVKACTCLTAAAWWRGRAGIDPSVRTRTEGDLGDRRRDPQEIEQADDDDEDPDGTGHPDERRVREAVPEDRGERDEHEPPCRGPCEDAQDQLERDQGMIRSEEHTSELQSRFDLV